MWARRERRGGADQRGAGPGEATTLRLGYFPNVTHATAIVGVQQGFLRDALGDVTLETATFNAGGQAIEALFSGAIDATYIGPNPAINGFTRSGGEAVRLIAGATSGGAFLVVRDGIESPEDLGGTTLSSPALGNTQDVALRAWLADQGYETTPEGGGEVSITPQENAQILESFRAGQIDGAWVPEPWATRLTNEGGGHVLVDERDLWPGGRFVTTHLLVSREYLDRNPGVVQRLLEGHVRANDFVNDRPDEAQAIVIAAIEEITGAALSGDTIAEAWGNLEFTVDPIASSLQPSADDAAGVGLLDPVDLDGIYALDLLNEVLAAQGREEVAGS
ncbi:MAG: ABC transporter substrate-binding protein [Egibacteraceae bacterium]